MDWIQFFILMCMAIPLLWVGGKWGIKLAIALERITKEVTPNGGNTTNLGDRVVKIEQTLEEHGLELKRQTSALHRIERAQKPHGEYPAERDA